MTVDPKLSFATAADPEDDDEAMVEKLVSESMKVLAGTGTVDEEAIRKTIIERLEQVRGRPIGKKETAPVVPPKVDIKKSAKKLDISKVVAAASGGEPYFYNKPEDDKFMRHYFDLRRKATVVGNMLIVGPSGAGKTESIKRIAADLNLPFYKFDCATVTSEDKWIGRREITDKGTFFRPSELLRWLEGEDFPPGVLLFDEINRVPPTRLNILLPILDGSQQIFIPDMDRYVRVHPETIIMGTANIGTPFGGTHVMDRAFRERFNFTLEREFPPQAEEAKVLISATGIDPDAAEMLVTIADKTRKKWQTDDLESPISTRTLKAAAILVASGMSIQTALEYTALPLYRADGGAQSERGIVKLIIEGKSK